MTAQEKLRKRGRRIAATRALKSADPVRVRIVARFGTLAAAAAFLEVSSAMLWFWLEGERTPPEDVLTVLLKETGMSREFWASAGADAAVAKTA